MNAGWRCHPGLIGRTLAKVDRVPAPLVVDTPWGQVGDEAPPAGRSRRRRRWIAAAAVVALLVVVIAFKIGAPMLGAGRQRREK